MRIGLVRAWSHQRINLWPDFENCGAIVGCTFQGAFESLFKAEPIGNNERCVAKASGLRGRGLEIVRVRATGDEDVDMDSVAADLLDKVAQD
jgi:hypothetical protein